MHVLLAQFYSSQPTPPYDNIAAALRAHGHTAWVGTPNTAGDVVWYEGDRIVATQPAVPRASSRLARLPGIRSLAERSRRGAQVRLVRDFIRQVNPDVVQVNATGLYRYLPVGMPRDIHFVLDVRQINEQHGTGFVGGLRSRYLNGMRGVYSRWLYERTCFLHAAGAEHVLGPDWARWATVVPMGVDPQFLMARTHDATLPTSESHPVSFIYVGRLAKRRMLERLIEAAALVRQKSGHFCLALMGYDAAEGHYQTVISQQGLADVVQIKPPVPYESVPEAVLGYDVALAYVPEIPADWKYHPTLKVLEYRAMGLPIIASDFAPNRDVVTEGVNGLLVENDVNAIAEAMLRFISDRPFLDACRRHAQTMRMGVTWEEVAEQYVADVYTPLVEGER